MTKKPQPDTKTESMPDAVWGAAAIGNELGLSASQVVLVGQDHRSRQCRAETRP